MVSLMCRSIWPKGMLQRNSAKGRALIQICGRRLPLPAVFFILHIPSSKHSPRTLLLNPQSDSMGSSGFAYRNQPTSSLPKWFLKPLIVSGLEIVPSGSSRKPNQPSPLWRKRLETQVGRCLLDGATWTTKRYAVSCNALWSDPDQLQSAT